MKIFENVEELIGNTPIVKINKINDGKANVFAKLEYFNPSNSVKDRAAKAMLDDAKEKGLIDDNTVIIEPTSGNTGIGLALCCAVEGRKLILTMPESMSEERKKMLVGYGAELVLTPKETGMKGAVDRANELLKEYDNAFMPMQFANPSNPKIHEVTTAQEIWNDLEGKVDAIVAGIGTAGTLCGTARGLKNHNSNIKAIGVEPFESPLLTKGTAGSHGIQGIGANFVPDNFDKSVVDELIAIPTQKAIEISKNLATKEGMLVGISAGAVMAAAIELSERDEYKGKNIVAILPDYGERYLSTPLFK